jgi:RNA polymerase-binding protein DksA
MVNHLTDNEIDDLRQKLQKNLDRTRENIERLSGRLSEDTTDPNYNQNYGDTGMRTQDAERVAELLEHEKIFLTELEQAISRIENGTYGICEVSGQPISKKRLSAKPTATTTIEVAKKEG